jgi:hypothetical protein
MKENNDNLILEAIQSLEKKVDLLSKQFGQCTADERLDNETVAIITAAAYNLFGRRVAVRNVRLLDDNPTGSNRFRQFVVVAD